MIVSNDKTIAPRTEHPSEGSSFVRRWSERKARARDLEQQTPAIAADQASSQAQASAAVRSPARELTDADMPPLDSLNEHSDYSGFFSAKVSETVRRQALRTLFRSPRCNVMDGLDVYIEDYTRFAELGDIITQDLRHRLAVEAQRLAQSLVDTAPVARASDGAVPAQLSGHNVDIEAAPPAPATGKTPS